MWLPAHAAEVPTEAFRRGVLKLFVERELLGSEVANGMLDCLHSGFSVHDGMWLDQADAAPRPTLRLTPWPRLTPLPTVPGAPLRFELLDRYGGESGGVGVDGNLAYLIVGGRIEVLDATYPRRVARLGRTPPRRHAPRLSSDVVAHGGLVAASTGDGVVIVDARAPRSPVEAGWIALEGSVERLVGNGRMVAAFVMIDYMGPSGIQLIDISEPAHPRLGGFVELIGLGNALWLQDDVLWALTGKSWEGAKLGGRRASQLG